MSDSFGADIRAIRKSRGHTLEVLAERLGCSLGWLSQVERGISHPPVEMLDRFADVLDVPLSILTGNAPEAEQGLIVRRNGRRAFAPRAKGLTEGLLSPDLTDDFEVVHSRFAPGSEIVKDVIRPTQELAFMISGKLDIWIEEQQFTVSQGDSFRVRGQAMRWANPYSQTAEAVWVISPPVY